MAQELLKLNFTFIFSGANIEKLESLASVWKMPFFSMDLNDPAQLEKIPSSIKYILNCAGPFGLYAPKLLKYISSKTLSYLDVSGEESFVFSSYEANKHTKATLIHACAFESFVADALVSCLKRAKEDFQELSSFYYFANPKVSPGTRLSIQLVRYFQTHAFENQKWVPRAPGETKLDIHFEGIDAKICNAIFAPYPEILFFSKVHKSLNAGSYILAKEGSWTQFVNENSEKKNIEEIVSKHRANARLGPNEAERKAGKFMVGVRAIYRDKSERRAQVFGIDTYRITAAILVQTLKQLMKSEKHPPGVFAPSELVDSFKILQSLKDEFQLNFIY